MNRHLDKRLLIGVLLFGIAYTATGWGWLSAGKIVLYEDSGPVAGVIGADDVLYYPLCGMWIGLGVSMIPLSILSYFSSNVLYLKLSALSLIAILLLGGGTAAAAIWYGS
jgi:hypothetical protein